MHDWPNGASAGDATRSRRDCTSLSRGCGVWRTSLREAVGGHGAEPDLESRTELFWSTLHGLATLTAANRLRPTHAEQRLSLLITQLTT